MKKKTESNNQVRKATLPMMQTRAALRPDTVDEENRSVEICFTTGERGLRKPWFDDPYYEELEVTANAVRSERLNKGLSVIDSHRTYAGIEGVFGITSDYRFENGELIGTVTFSDDEESMKVFRKVASGVLRHVSLGYQIHRMQRVGEEEGIPVYRAIDWSPTELSIVPVSFETNNGVRSGEQHQTYDCIIEGEDEMRFGKNKHVKRSPEQDASAPKGGAGGAVVDGGEQNRGNGQDAPAPAAAPAPTPTPQVNENEIRSNLNQYIDAARHAGFDIEHATRAFTAGTNINEYRRTLIEELGQRSQQNAPNVPMVDDQRQDHSEAKREDFANAIRARVTGDFSGLDDKSRTFAQMPMMEAARHYMMMNGQRDVLGMSGLNFAKRALQTTSDLPLILENVMNKELLQAYEETQRTFLPIARRTTVNDFREKNTYKMGDAPNLLPLGENGEYQYGKFSESKESYRLSTYARKIGFTRQMMINDDLSALSRFPQLFGGAASRLESDIVWGLILNYDFIRNKAANHKLSDGQALYSGAHNNTISTALSTDGLSDLRKLGRKQKTLDGNFMNVQYNVLAVGEDLETTAQQILNGLIMAQQTSNVNVFRESMDLIVEPRIAAVAGGATAFYGFSNAIRAIEYAYLAGNEGLYTEIVESTDIDGTTILARHDFGAGYEDFRGTAKSTGA